MATSQQLETVKSLFYKARPTSGATEAERTEARNKALKLMDKYGISKEDLKSSGPRQTHKPQPRSKPREDEKEQWFYSYIPWEIQRHRQAYDILVGGFKRNTPYPYKFEISSDGTVARMNDITLWLEFRKYLKITEEKLEELNRAQRKAEKEELERKLREKRNAVFWGSIVWCGIGVFFAGALALIF